MSLLLWIILGTLSTVLMGTISSVESSSSENEIIFSPVVFVGGTHTAGQDTTKGQSCL